ncbi:MAG: lipoyl(octanoyl) transferase LipB [Bacteroidetes bacterium]|nr:lipoyl(octanoyl) transferase LipB [Bacteroidota bacterium]MBI3765018.1 lipoyl(octanoyl) transferase LipB [Ignavibacteriales bacterium]
MKEISVINLGLTDYKSIWDLQRKIFDLRVEGKIPDALLLNEHNHVYTLGKSSNDNHLLAREEELSQCGAEVFHIDRGGDITYHGPGQLVGYPILKLDDYYSDVHRYLRDIEEVIIRTLQDYDIKAHRDRDFTGVWVGSDKIAAIGVKVSHWVTMHGFAFNVNTDLSYFDRIIPCGIFHRGVTSLERVLGAQVPLHDVASRIVYHFGRVFDCQVIESGATEIADSFSLSSREKVEWLQ